jgi:hypothetical protein
MLKKLLIGIVVVLAAFAGYAATRPDAYHVERSAKIEAPAPVIFSQIENFRAWAAWSPWEKLDPNLKRSYDGPPSGVGAKYAWAGNKQVGKGRMETIESQPPTLIKERLEFIEPFAGLAETAFQLVPDGERNTTVTWRMDGKNNFVGKVFGIFMNMDKMVGGDFDRGLASLRQVAMAEARKQQEELAAAKVRAAGEAEAKARADAEAAAEKAAPAKAKGKSRKDRKGRRKPAR